ncbi:hypothetical protein H0H81_012214 [Sphagnurus paluster]|uniref:DUF6535 domain-containing protein n=1 Tax=Sphagnurus paluster TaxID=117069 RepID=A0A9P7G006_9AGAR|nr:hypothetical protein H0H81_012214 [Sphagnurus paluster]
MDEKGFGSHHSSHDDPSTKIWSSYISRAEKHNRDLARSWKGDMDAILIFAGLFSASVTAFIIESYKTLSPAPEDTTNALLAQISRQLTVMSNTSVEFPMDSISAEFAPPTSALICNILWFLSLGFSLASALSATLVEQWVRNYLQAAESYPTPHERARIFAYLYQGLEKFKMAALVEAIPMLLHISLLLFFAGLVQFLRPVNMVLSYLTLAILIICLMLYALATIIPVFRRDCPYQTPLSGMWWKIMKPLRMLRHRESRNHNHILYSCSMEQARETHAISISPERDQRDFKAMSWALENMRHDSEFEAFVEVIPRAVSGFDYSAKLLLHRLLFHQNLAVRLGHRIPRLLVSCRGVVLDPAIVQKRAATCLAAIWSLTMMAVHTNSLDSSPVSCREALRFDEFTLRDIRMVTAEIPSIEDVGVSAMTVVARGLIDMYIDQAINLELRLKEIMDTVVISNVVVEGKNTICHDARSEPRILIRIHRTMESLGKVLRSGQAIAFPDTFVLFSAAFADISRLVRLIFSPSQDTDLGDLATHTLKFLRLFQVQLNQSGFSLAVDYAAHFLARRALPYEAFNTFRRIFLNINFELPLNVESQTRFVSYLDDALELDSEGGTRLPQSIINIILGLTRALRDPTCALKAKTIIKRRMQFFISREEAQNALSFLSAALPRPAPMLDLFSGHLYSNVKLDKPPLHVHELATVDKPHPMPPRRHETV